MGSNRPCASPARSRASTAACWSVKSAKSGDVTINLTGDAAVFGVSKATIADIKPGAFIGVGAMPQPDGSQRAIQVTVFAEVQRGQGEGHRPWDARPNSTMTNGTVEQVVAGVDGEVVMVKYKDGEKKIVIPPDAVILAYAVGSKDELKPGAHVAIVRALKKPDELAGGQPRQCRARRRGSPIGVAAFARRVGAWAEPGAVTSRSPSSSGISRISRTQPAVAAANARAPRADPRSGGAPRRRAPGPRCRRRARPAAPAGR